MPGMKTETVRSTPMTRRFSAQPAKNTSPSFEPKQANAQGVPEQFTRTKVVISQSEKTYVDTHTNQRHTIKSNSSLEKHCNALTSHLSPLTFSLSLSPLTSNLSLSLSLSLSLLGFPGLSSQSVSGFVGPFRPENLETDWDDKPGKFVIPVRFEVL